MSRFGVRTRSTGRLLPTLLLVLLTACVTETPTVQPEFSHGGLIALPEPDREGALPVERAIAGRRSVREFREFPLDFAQVGQILWAAQGITLERGDDATGLRAAPSAGALYPLEVYLVDGRVRGLPAGVYHYLPEAHALEQVIQGDERQAVWRAAGEQDAVRDAPVIVVIT
ncbi:MAG: SagB/ThcOx family dehydrogenase, partial [Chloroflexi bacterium]|nr:SagB/ThcOx family dehydrogenase [Chloroflexota bacterium]